LTTVQSHTKEDVIAAVISVPAAFELPQNEATKKAAQLAGLSNCILIQEPTAAALAYGFGSEHDRAFWMVYDIGGGTFDAAIVRLNEGLIQIVNHGGDTHLGGGNIDRHIVEQLLAPAVAKEYALSDFKYGNPDWELAFAWLEYQAEKAKIELSQSEAAIIDIEDLAGDHGERMSFEYELHRRDIEPLVEPLVRKSVGICKQALTEKKLSPADIEKIILVGGPTLTPILRDIISDELGIPLDFHMDPLTVVAQGAAIFAGTQRMPAEIAGSYITPGQYSLELEYETIGSEPEPSIGGRIISPEGESLKDFTVEFVESKDRWQSGRIPLGDNGEFMTTVHADKSRANEFLIELRDGSGNIHGTNPDRFTYTIGAVVSKPILTHSVGVALATNEMKVLAEKGDPLPHRSPRSPYYTTIALKKGESGTCLVIPIVEGNNLRHADRNLRIGLIEVPGDTVPCDLPAGSEVEITMKIDESRLVSCEAYVPLLDKIFPAETRLGYADIDPKEQAEQFEKEKTRMDELYAKAEGTDNQGAKEALSDNDAQGRIDEIEASLSAAESDGEASSRCQKEILSLQSHIDTIEDELEWPSRISEAEEKIEAGSQIVKEHGTSDDKRIFKSLVSEIGESISSHEPDLLIQKMDALDSLVMPILLKRPEIWVSWFNQIVEKESHMKDRNLAKQLIPQGRRAIDDSDLDGLQAVVRQLMSLLPADEQQEVRGYGSTII